MSEQAALAIQEHGVGQLAHRVQLTKAALAVEKQQRAILAEFVRDCMVKGTDYGVIPGTPKPTLLKPGAEKLVDLFRCTPEFRLVPEHCQQDFGTGLFKYTFECRLSIRETGSVLAVGFGSANSREARYRWRDGKRKCPACSAEQLNKSKNADEWYCWVKKGGCGATFPLDDPKITGQAVGRTENPDIADLDNTILKMAKKRALVDGAIALARCSDLFTQDLDDLVGHEEAPSARKREPHYPEAPSGTVEMAADFERARAAAGGKPSEEWTHVAFGASKGKRIADLGRPDLDAAIVEGETKLAGASPKAAWRGKLQTNLAALQAERDHRGRAGVGDPTPEEQAAILAREVGQEG